MPIDTTGPRAIQRRMTEVGRIRMGDRYAKGERLIPRRLDHFRLTSHSRDVIASVAETYGGDVSPWDTDTGRQWQVTITADQLEVLIAPGEAFTQWFELWAGGGCERRCNGTMIETLEGRDVRDQEVECLCPVDAGERQELAKDGKACKPTTRLSVWLPKIPGLGIWRAETHGFYAAAELPSVVYLLQDLYGQGYRQIATLRIGKRSVKRPGQPTKTFPVLELDVPRLALDGILEAGARLPGEGVPQIGPGLAGDGVKQIGPGAPLAPNESPFGPNVSQYARVPRPLDNEAPALPGEPEARIADPAEPATRPAPDAPPAPNDIDAVAGDQDDDGGIDTLAPKPAEPEPIVGEAIHPATGEVVDPTTGEIIGRKVDNGLTSEQFKGMVRLLGAAPELVMELCGELFPGIAPRSLTDDQRGELYNRLAMEPQ